MTPLGQNILDLFILSLDATRPSGKKALKDQESGILKMKYNFKENVYLPLNKIALHFGLSGERIRQLHDKALNKIRRAGRNIKEENNPCVKLVRCLEKEIMSGDQDQPEAVCNFCIEHFSEMNGTVIIKLISMILWYDKNIVKKNISYYKEATSRRTQIRNSKIEDLQKNLLNNIVWFERKANCETMIRELLPQREVTHDERYKSGVFYSNKYKREIQYESQLEYKFIQMLEDLPIIKHVVEQPVTIEFSENKRTYRYTPDFAVLLETNEGFLVEIKDYSGMVDCKVHRKVEALIEYCKTNGLGILLTDGRHTINEILKYDYNKDLESEIKSLFTKYRILRPEKYYELKNKYKFRHMEFLNMVLYNKWGYYKDPFKLVKNNNSGLFRNTMIKEDSSGNR